MHTAFGQLIAPNNSATTFDDRAVAEGSPSPPARRHPGGNAIASCICRPEPLKGLAHELGSKHADYSCMASAITLASP
jgi:hypothetical protein